MTATSPRELRVVSFGDLDGNLWGSAVDADQPAIVFGTADGTGSAAGRAAVVLTDDAGNWRLAGEDFELLITAVPDSSDGTGDGNDHRAGELCRVSGTVSVAGHDRAVDCVGVRSTGAGLAPKRVQSLRGLSGWFASDHALTVLSLRPPGGDGHELDLLAATVFEPDHWMDVDDPRMSTTFRPGELPARASLELWISDGEEQYLRRAAAEAVGDGACVDGDGVSLRVTPLRCHTAGLDGAGVYLLARLQ